MASDHSTSCAISHRCDRHVHRRRYWFEYLTAGNGDELHGSFNVQVIPTAAAHIVDLVGQATFIGGSGLFSGASGSALFSGTGVFTSATSAVASLAYRGEVALVPEPVSWLLLSAGMVALALRRPHRTPSEPDDGQRPDFLRFRQVATGLEPAALLRLGAVDLAGAL